MSTVVHIALNYNHISQSAALHQVTFVPVCSGLCTVRKSKVLILLRKNENHLHPALLHFLSKFKSGIVLF